MKDNQPHLVFVYNADQGLRAEIVGSLQKLFAPTTYQCRLCQLSYGVIRPHRSWEMFLARLKLPVETLHRDEFREVCPHLATPLPAVFLRTGTVWQELVSVAEIRVCSTTDELIALVEKKLAETTVVRHG